ncbi:MAG: IMPACT family protein [Bacteroidota bacterium]
MLKRTLRRNSLIRHHGDNGRGLTFFSIGTETQSELVIKRSRFIGSARRVQTSDEARTYVADRSSVNMKADHNCWGYKISIGTKSDTSEIFSSDDGEPSGTAGKPIIGAIEKNAITNTVVVVSRYFGGHKLGIRGLIDAYSQAAHAAIKLSGRFEYRLFENIEISCGYSEWTRIVYELEKRHIQTQKKDISYSENVQLTLFVESEKLKDLIVILNTYKMNQMEVDYRLTGNRQFHAVNKL